MAFLDFIDGLTGAGRATDIAATFALVGVVASATVSSLISRRTIYINSVTAERSKWIAKLRDNMSTLNGGARSYLGAGSTTKNEDFHRTTKKSIESVLVEIQLQLNPMGSVDRNLLMLLRKFGDDWLTVGFDQGAWEKLFVGHAQWLLKAEWEKVKREARGPIGRLWSSLDEFDRAWLYRCYVKKRPVT